MKVNSNIFRAYDIRGVYPEELNEEVAYKIGRAFVVFLEKHNKSKKLKIVVGRDGRISSPFIFKEIVRGIINQGADVISIGLSTTPMLYFSVAHFGFDGGLNITASHNPPEYNGFKFVRENAVPISGESGIKEIRDLVLNGQFKKTKNGKIIKKQIFTEYINFNISGYDLNKIKPLRIVVDTGNAVPGIIVPKFFERIRCKIYYIYRELDGNFPNHLPCPHVEENISELKKEVMLKKANLGIAFDGDGDRIIFVDEKGRMIVGDYITALMVDLILEKNPGEKILCDVRSSNIIKETTEKAGGNPVLYRVGHSFIKEKMRKENIIFQGELNGHYYHRNHYFSEAPFFVILEILKKISQEGKNISELINPYVKYFHSGEINFRTKNKKKVLKALEKKIGKKGDISNIDGLRIDFKDWWFNVRPSNTDPVLRLVIEAKTRKLMNTKTKKILNLIRKLS